MTALALADPVATEAERPARRLTLVSDNTGVRTVRVALVCSSALVRAAFRALLESERDVLVAGEAGSGAEVLELALRERPDVVVMCIATPGLEAIDAVRGLTAEPRVPVVVLSSSDASDVAFAALRAGASGFLPLD